MQVFQTRNPRAEKWELFECLLSPPCTAEVSLLSIFQKAPTSNTGSSFSLHSLLRWKYWQSYSWKLVMAGNDWINSYLEAILDVGPGIGDAKSSLLLRERGRFSPTRYFVEEVITGFDETDLYRSWVRVCISNSQISLLSSFVLVVMWSINVTDDFHSRSSSI